jgi:hypothetical protein
VPRTAVVGLNCRAVSCGADVLVRYRYRIEPTAAQRVELARVFDCVRVVFNDALRVRQDAYQAATLQGCCHGA